MQAVYGMGVYIPFHSSFSAPETVTVGYSDIYACAMVGAEASIMDAIASEKEKYKNAFNENFFFIIAQSFHPALCETA